jgi:RND family efflux transporter MFP subunit
MFKRAHRFIRLMVTTALVAGGVLAGVFLWRYYVNGPWTRDGQVQADVIVIAPEVSGRVIKLNVAENQLVHKGDVLYEIDPFDFQVDLAAAQATVQQRLDDFNVKQAEAQRRAKLGTLSTSVEEKQTYAGSADVARAAYAAALSQLSEARVNIERTQVHSPVNGYVTNLLLREGDYATKGARNVSVIDSDSFRVDAYFEETKLQHVHVGGQARITLMGFDAPVLGHVESVARGISSPNYVPGTLGLATVNPVFTWVRLAQRIPVRIHIDRVPPSVLLAAGMTCSVTVGPQAADGGTSLHGVLSRLMSD